MSSDVKLSYSFNQRRVRLDFPGVACLKSAEPPSSLIKKARAKLESERSQNNIDFFEIYDKEIETFWKIVRKEGKSSAAIGKLLSFTIGAGAKNLPEIEVSQPTDGKSMFNLSFNDTAVAINNWRYEWVLLNISKKLEEIGIKGKLHAAQIKGAWLRATKEEKIKELPIAHVPTENPKNKPYIMMANKSRGELMVAIHNKVVFSDKSLLNKIIKAAADGAKKMTESTGSTYNFMKEELTSELKSALMGPELAGQNLPLIILIGSKDPDPAKANDINIERKKPKSKIATDETASKKEPKKKKKEGKPAPEPSSGHYPGMGYLSIAVSDDCLEASVIDFDMGLYGSQTTFELNGSWIKNELKRYGLRADCEKEISAVLRSIATKEDISGMLLVVGREGKPAKKPYLHKSYLDTKVEKIEGKDLRDAQSKSKVMPGDLVFEVKYKTKGEPGLDVYGEQIIPEPGDAMVVDLGAGIEIKHEGKYHATVEGQPVLEGNTVSISQVFSHKGDINLKSGNIYFNGPANIDGNIQSGATVMVKGDLTITGSIDAAFVRSGGSIIVKGGITTSESGRVQARENIEADFIGNSNITCGGDLHVKKAVLNSEIIVGGDINTNTSDGTLAGGNISCRGDIRVGKLGFPKGDVTKIASGLDWRAELTLRIRKNRLVKLKSVNEVDRKSLRELVRKKGAQLTAKHKESIEHLKERLQRQRAIMDRIEESIANAEKLMNWDKEVRIFVHDSLSTNVDIVVGGTKILVPGEVAGVVLSTQRTKGSYVKAMDEEDMAS